MTRMLQPEMDFGYRKSAKDRPKLHALDTELIVDNFAGGGGASTGIEDALGRPPDIAINHDEHALTMHEFNHPATIHLCESVWRVCPDRVTRGQPVGLGWFSPDCRHFSRAKGTKPVSRKIRCLAWIVVRWAKKKRPKVIILENVREFEDWGPCILMVDEFGDPILDKNGNKQYEPDPEKKGESFKRWWNALKRLGYKIEKKILNAADHGAPTHRRRLFIIARCDGQPIVWPKATHGPGRKKPYRTAAECIDWSLPMASIFLTREEAKAWAKENKMKGVPQRPLKEKTLRRIALGVKKFILDNPKPFIVKINHGGEHFRGQPVDIPLSTVTGAHGHAVVSPSLIEVERTYKDDTSRSLEVPLNTITARPKGGKHALVAALLTKHYGGVVGHEIDKPAGTITSVDHHALTAAHLIKMYGTGIGQSADAPLGTVTAGGFKFGLVYAFLCKYFGTAIGQSAEEPLHTITTKARFNVVTVQVDGTTYAIADICMRMLQPRELARAQGFPDDYILTGSNSNQVAKIGNSVPPDLAEALVRANCQFLARRKRK